MKPPYFTRLAALPAMAAACAFLSPVSDAQDEAKKTPNILVILTDDQGFADYSLSPFSKPGVRTPRIDSLLSEGARFTHAHTSGVTCSPTRAGIMTGNYQQRHGLYHTPDSRVGLDPKAKLMPVYFKEAGYSTACFGKWHLGLTDEFNPVRRGFDTFYGFLGHGGHDYFKLNPPSPASPGLGMYRNLEPITDKGYLTTRIGDETVRWIKDRKQQPWFAYVCFNAVHSPAQAPAADVAKFKTGDPQRDILLAMLMHLDLNIGRIIDALKDAGTYDNTLIFILTDNGGAPNMRADNTPLRGAKGSLWEGGHRTFFGVTWKAEIKPGTVVDAQVMSFDILPTALAAAGLPIPVDRIIDGKNLLPAIRGETDKVHDYLAWDNARGPFAIYQDGWKLLRDKERGAQGKLRDTLYQLSEDPGEENNLAAKHPEKVRDLLALHAEWRSRMKPLTPKQQQFTDFQNDRKRKKKP